MVIKLMSLHRYRSNCKPAIYLLVKLEGQLKRNEDIIDNMGKVLKKGCRIVEASGFELRACGTLRCCRYILGMNSLHYNQSN